jgi:hypothetical protein
MVPTLLETLRDDTEFDLDVRLEAVPRHFSVDAAVKPTEGDCPDATAFTQCGQGTCTLQPS